MSDVARNDINSHNMLSAAMPEDEDGAVHGPTVLAYVTMARTAREFSFLRRYSMC